LVSDPSEDGEAVVFPPKGLGMTWDDSFSPEKAREEGRGLFCMVLEELIAFSSDFGTSCFCS
jgi:hypothetical protein